MSTIKQVRAAVVKYVAEQTRYDAETVRISKTSEVSAILDANKTFNGPHTVRCLVGQVEDIMRDIALHA